MLSALPTYAPAARALSGLEGVDAYLRQRGESRIPSERARMRRRRPAHVPVRAVRRTQRVLRSIRIGSRVAYDELEQALYEGRAVTTVVAPLLGIALDTDTTEIALGEGLALVRGDALDDAPPDAVWGDAEEPHVLAC